MNSGRQELIDLSRVWTKREMVDTSALDAPRAPTGVPSSERGRRIYCPAPRGVASAEQDHVVMFTDLVGFTEIAWRVGSRATADLLSRVMRAQIGVIEASGGTIRNIMGDAIMASWAIEPDDDRAATCARAVRVAFAIAVAISRLPSPLQHERGLAVRIGLHVGPAVLETLAEGHTGGRTLIGDTVNIAARLQQARPSAMTPGPMGTVRASAEVYEELPLAEQGLFLTYSWIEACGRPVRMHDGPRDGVPGPVTLPDPWETDWAHTLDRLAGYLASA